MPSRKFLLPRSGGHKIKIKGRLVNVHLARIVYRCEACHGQLKRQNKGLCCKANPTHRGFVHQSQAERVEQVQAGNLEKLNNIYEIQNGKVVIKCQS
jgi:hypothetical protein